MAIDHRDLHAAGIIPFRVRVGVTGHREPPSDAELGEQVRRALVRIQQLAQGRTPVHLAVVSALAEGADQLVAEIALQDDPEASLEALLPMSPTDYVARFQRTDSRPAFQELTARASSVVPLQRERETAEQAYERVGRSVVDSSDVVIALWDGQPARGPAGTANIVAYARGESVRPGRRVPLIWINTEPPFSIQEEMGEGVLRESFQELDRFNAAKVPARAFHAATLERMDRLLSVAEGAGLDGGYLREFGDWVHPYYARADTLADRWQARYRRLTNALFLAAAGAVMVGAAQVLFASDRPGLVVFEVGLLAIVLAALFLGRKLRVHERWISCRVLAERFRSALFLALAGGASKLESHAEQTGLGATGEWARRAFDEVWTSRPKTSPSPAQTEALKRFITTALIDDQLQYHRQVADVCRRRQLLLTRVSYVLFGTTFLAALLHGIGIGGHGDGGVASALTFLAIGLPALAGALAGIEAQRQYERNRERSEGMAHRLEIAREEMLRAADLEAVQSILQETEKILLDESNDWLVTVRFQGIKLAV